MLASSLLYIFWFLHQTTTLVAPYLLLPSCISFDSYIKPQPKKLLTGSLRVVYLLIPTSNHNYDGKLLVLLALYIFWFLHQTTTRSLNLLYIYSCISFDSYIKPQPMAALIRRFPVVYLLIPTSNHNLLWLSCLSSSLYIFWFLHQTTTSDASVCFAVCCISFDSYIKPQLPVIIYHRFYVVYLLIPTSNHNPTPPLWFTKALYIFWFLHQTTTHELSYTFDRKLYIFWFLHQTTTYKNTS